MRRERERGREGSEVVLCRGSVGWARGARRRRRRRRRGSWSRSNEPREKLSGAGRGAGRGAAVALSNKLDCLHEKAERLVRGPVVVETLSLSLSARSLSSFSSSLPAISLSCSSLDGALRCAQETRQRRRNARPAHRVHTCTTYYTSVRP